MAQTGRNTSARTKTVTGMKSAKKKLTPLPRLKKQVEALCNRYARLRDCFGEGGCACISCGLWFPYSELDGGHYIPATVASTRFNEINVNAQCHKCNRFLHANLRGYFRGMEAKYGRERLDDLEASAGSRKWTRPELLELKEYYKEKIRAIESGVDPREGNSGMGMLDLFKD